MEREMFPSLALVSNSAGPSRPLLPGGLAVYTTIDVHTSLAVLERASREVDRLTSTWRKGGMTLA